MVANPDLIEDPAPTHAQIKRLFELINTGRLDRNALQAILSRYNDQPGPILQNIRYPMEHVIDLDAEPFIPERWSIDPEDQIASRARGMWRFDPNSINLYLAEPQLARRYIQGHNLKDILHENHYPVLPANVLDYLLDHQDLIPEYWKLSERGEKRYILFWGTIYFRLYGGLAVRCLFYDRSEWRSDYEWFVNYEFGLSYASAILTGQLSS